VHLGIVHEELACRLLGVIEFAGPHEGDDGIRVLGEGVRVLEGRQGGFG
jgi:hypothetical protein